MNAQRSGFCCRVVEAIACAFEGSQSDPWFVTIFSSGWDWNAASIAWVTKMPLAEVTAPCTSATLPDLPVPAPKFRRTQPPSCPRETGVSTFSFLPRDAAKPRRLKLDISLLRCLFVARVENAVDHDRQQQHHALDDLLIGVGEIHYRHAVA